MSQVTNISATALRIFGVAAIILALVCVLYWRGTFTTNPRDSEASLPFRPKVVYHEAEVTITNPEAEPYVNTSLHIYIESTRYEAQVGTIRPGESVSRALSSLKNERGESFTPGAHRTSELEVRARFGGYNVHKDFPPPPP